MRVFILLFNAGTNNEGIYSRKIGDRNEVLMFELEDDATRFALQLEAQDFPSATVEEIDETEIREFCDSAGYEVKFISNETLEIPSQQNMEETDWREDGSHQDSMNQGLNPDTAPKSSNHSNNTDESEDDPKFSEEDLKRIRSQLEGLL